MDGQHDARRVESPTVPLQGTRHQLLRARLIECVEHRATIVAELGAKRDIRRATGIRSFCSILMMTTEATITLSLMSDLMPEPGLDPLAPMELVFLVVLLLSHPRVGLPMYDSAKKREIEYLKKRAADLMSLQCELENYAEIAGIHYRDIILSDRILTTEK